MIGDVVAGALAFSSWFAAWRATRSAARERLLRRAGKQPSMPRRRLAELAVAGHRRRRLIVVLLAAGPGLVLVQTVAGPAGPIAGAAVLLTVPTTIRRRRARGQLERLEAQLAAAVAAVSAALRAGLSLSQSVRFAAQESEPPLLTALGEIADREDLGVPLDASLERWAASSGSSDVRLVANVLRLRIGSGLPGVLDRVAQALRGRQAARREVRSLTAQARLSGMILGFLPIGFFLFLSITSRRDMSAAYASSAGVAAIVGGLALQAGAFAWIRRLVSVEV